MSEIKKPTVQLNEHIGNIIFDKKEIQPEDKPLTLKEKMVSMSNTEFGIKEQSVALPNNYNPILKSESQVVDWLRNKLHSQHSSAYLLSLKYGEKLKVKLQQKEPYNNN